MEATLDINDIYMLGNYILSELSEFLESLDSINVSINEFCCMLSEQDGAAVTSMKNYITRYRDAIYMVAESLYSAYGQVLPVYEGSFSTLDGDAYAVVNTGVVAEVVNAYRTASTWLENEADIVDDIFRKVSGFCEADKPQAETLYEDMDELVERERQFREDIITVENAAMEGEICMLSELTENSLTYLRSIHEHRFVLKSDNTSHLSPLQHPEYLTSLAQVTGYMSENKDFIGEMSVICQQYNDTYVRDGRIHEGIVKVMHATTLLGGGRAAIGAAEIATVGFLKGMDLIFGTSSMVFGAAEGTEGIQDITYASLGELDMESQNVIKSMLGDKAYHNLMYVSEVGANVSALASVLNYRLVENAMYAGTPDVERLEAGGSQTNVRTEPVNDVLPEGAVTGNGGGKTGTVWDNIMPTQDNWPNTQIPRSFEVEVNGQKMWVHGNATEHIYDDVYAKIIAGEGTPYTNPNLYTQELMSDFYGSLEQATTSGIKYGELISEGNWEFIFAKPREEGLLPVIKHAQFNGW